VRPLLKAGSKVLAPDCPVHSGNVPRSNLGGFATPSMFSGFTVIKLGTFSAHPDVFTSLLVQLPISCSAELCRFAIMRWLSERYSCRCSLGGEGGSAVQDWSLWLYLAVQSVFFSPFSEEAVLPQLVQKVL